MAPCQTAAEPVGGGIGLQPNRLLAQCLAHEDGTGEPVELQELYGQPVEITLEIDHVAQQESLAVSVFGSPDEVDWGRQPLITLPHKHYCGVYSIALDLAKHPQIRFLRAQWKMSCWRRGCAAPLFGFTVSVEEGGSRSNRRYGQLPQQAGDDQEIPGGSVGAPAENLATTG